MTDSVDPTELTKDPATDPDAMAMAIDPDPDVTSVDPEPEVAKEANPEMTTPEAVGIDNEGNLIYHNLDRGSTSSVPSTEVLSRLCHVCGRTFGDAVEHAAHMGEHEGQSPDTYELAAVAKRITARRAKAAEKWQLQAIEAFKDEDNANTPEEFDSRNVDPVLLKSGT